MFDMGYLGYVANGQVISDGGESKDGRTPLNEGFYSEESEYELGLANEGYHLSTWKWEEKPYGLTAPKIKYGKRKKN